MISQSQVSLRVQVKSAIINDKFEVLADFDLDFIGFKALIDLIPGACNPLSPRR